MSEHEMLYPEIEEVVKKYGFNFVETVPSSGRSKFSQPLDLYRREKDDKHPPLELEIISGASVKPWEFGSVRSEKVNASITGSGSYCLESREYTTVDEIIKRIQDFGKEHNLA